MSDAVRQLEPSALWNHFSDLNEVPRPSKGEEKVIQFMKEFGESLGLPTVVDQTGNVIISKPASSGMEDRTPIVLQSHLDMVHQKNNDTDFDFATSGIKMLVKDDWVHAEGTTLGADNGIGVAAMMAILKSDDISHPAVDCLFTIDEETGMTGAKGLKSGVLKGEIMLNLDTEEDNELTIGCAGGVDVTATGTYRNEACPSGMEGRHLTISGLKGGHSGMDIHLGRGNANKLANRVLFKAANQFGARLSSVDGGGLRNAIPRESNCWFAIPSEKAADFDRWFVEIRASICSEYEVTDPEITLTCVPAEVGEIADESFQKQFFAAIHGILSGVFRLSPTMKDLTQTSNNLARIELADGKFLVGNLTRSSVDSERDALAESLAAVLETTGAKIEFSGKYPGWIPAPGSEIVSLMADLYEELFEEPAHVAAGHGGLECGILGAVYPEMQLVSFGPNIRGAHSPEERVQISSVQKFWSFFQETLKRIPAKA